MEQIKYSLTERQKEIYDYLKLYHQANGIPPMQTEAAEHFGISQASVAKHLAALERRGWVIRGRGMKNALVIID